MVYHVRVNGLKHAAKAYDSVVADEFADKYRAVRVTTASAPNPMPGKGATLAAINNMAAAAGAPSPLSRPALPSQVARGRAAEDLYMN